MAFSATESAFEGFRIIRREPKSLLAWAVLTLGFSVAVSAVMLPAMRGMMAGLTAFQPGAAAPATTLSPTRMAAFSSMSWIYLVLLPLDLVMFAVLNAAVYRAVLRPQERGLGRLKLGADEFRLMGLWVVLGAIFFAGSIAVALVLVIIAGIVAFSTGGSSGAGAVAALIIVVLYLALLVGYCWFAVRLSLAGPMTFAERRLNLFGSWKLTKGRFWPLFGCYLLVTVFAVLIALAEGVVIGAINLGFSGGSFAGMISSYMHPDYSSYASYYSPARILQLILAAPFAAVFSALMAAAPAEAYREIAGPKPEDQAEAFA